MTDVADILGLGRGSGEGKEGASKRSKKKPKRQRPKGMSREVFNLVSDDGFVSMVRTIACAWIRVRICLIC